jgi:hypothetical protein
LVSETADLGSSADVGEVHSRAVNTETGTLARKILILRVIAMLYYVL